MRKLLSLLLSCSMPLSGLAPRLACAEEVSNSNRFTAFERGLFEFYSESVRLQSNGDGPGDGEIDENDTSAHRMQRDGTKLEYVLRTYVPTSVWTEALSILPFVGRSWEPRDATQGESASLRKALKHYAEYYVSRVGLDGSLTPDGAWNRSMNEDGGYTYPAWPNNDYNLSRNFNGLEILYLIYDPRIGLGDEMDVVSKTPKESSLLDYLLGPEVGPERMEHFAKRFRSLMRADLAAYLGGENNPGRVASFYNEIKDDPKGKLDAALKKAEEERKAAAPLSEEEKERREQKELEEKNRKHEAEMRPRLEKEAKEKLARLFPGTQPGDEAVRELLSVLFLGDAQITKELVGTEPSRKNLLELLQIDIQDYFKGWDAARMDFDWETMKKLKPFEKRMLEYYVAAYCPEAPVAATPGADSKGGAKETLEKTAKEGSAPSAPPDPHCEDFAKRLKEFRAKEAAETPRGGEKDLKVNEPPAPPSQPPSTSPGTPPPPGKGGAAPNITADKDKGANKGEEKKSPLGRIALTAGIGALAFGAAGFLVGGPVGALIFGGIGAGLGAGAAFLNANPIK